MTWAGTVTMSARELDRLEVLGRVAERRLSQRRAAEQLGLSERQVRRLCRALAQQEEWSCAVSTRCQETKKAALAESGSLVEAQICRPELLCETEALAVLTRAASIRASGG